MNAHRTIEAVVEIAGGLDEEAQHERLRWAYRRSRNGLVILALTEMPLPLVEQLLDPIVAQEGNGVHGVLFMDAREEPRLAGLAAAARHVLPASEGFRDRVARWRSKIEAPVSPV